MVLVKTNNWNSSLIHYAGYLENGQLFDTSFMKMLLNLYGKFDQTEPNQNGYAGYPVTIAVYLSFQVLTKS